MYLFLFPDSGLNLLNGFDFLFWPILNGVTLKTSNLFLSSLEFRRVLWRLINCSRIWEQSKISPASLHGLSYCNEKFIYTLLVSQKFRKIILLLENALTLQLEENPKLFEHSVSFSRGYSRFFHISSTSHVTL